MAVTKSVGTPGLASQNPVAHRLGTNAVHHRFPNWGTRTPRGTRSGSGGTRGENVRDNRKRTEFAEFTV